MMTQKKSWKQTFLVQQLQFECETGADIKHNMFNRPGVAGAILQSVLQYKAQ